MDNELSVYEGEFYNSLPDDVRRDIMWSDEYGWCSYCGNVYRYHDKLSDEFHTLCDDACIECFGYYCEDH